MVKPMALDGIESEKRWFKMNAIQKQKGMTFWGVAFLLLVIGFSSLLVMRLFPVYFEHYSVKTALKSVQEKYKKESDMPLTRANIRRSLSRMFLMSSVKRVTMNDIKVSIKNGQYTVNVAYQAKTPLIANIDVLIGFDDTVVITNGG